MFRDVVTRRAYAAQLGAVVRTGGMLHLMCFSDRTLGDWGPQRTATDELGATFAGGWQIHSLVPTHFEINPGLPVETPNAWLLTATRS